MDEHDDHFSAAAVWGDVPSSSPASSLAHLPVASSPFGTVLEQEQEPAADEPSQPHSHLEQQLQSVSLADQQTFSEEKPTTVVQQQQQQLLFEPPNFNAPGRMAGVFDDPLRSLGSTVQATETTAGLTFHEQGLVVESQQLLETQFQTESMSFAVPEPQEQIPAGFAPESHTFQEEERHPEPFEEKRASSSSSLPFVDPLEVLKPMDPDLARMNVRLLEHTTKQKMD